MAAGTLDMTPRAMNSECAIAVVLFVILATGNLVIRSVDMPLPVVALPVVIDILFPVALIAAQVQFFRNTGEGSSPTEPP
jgi:hypothetical protein